jgi:hypothetical protein
MSDQKRRKNVARQEPGENEGNGSDFDELPIGSVIYVGRGSFRMEPVALEPDGVVRPITGIVTAPLHATPLESREGNELDGAPALRPLFGSQVDLPVLAAPSGAVSLHAPVVTLSRAMLATVCGIVLLCGMVVGTAARHLIASPAPLAVVPAPVAALALAPAALAAPAVAPSVAAAAAAPPSPPPLVALPAPLTIRARARTAARAAAEPTGHKIAVAPPAKPLQAKPWVDPWAE